MSEWQPIETAPKNNTPIDIWSKQHGRLPNYQRVFLSKIDIFYEPVKGEVCVIRDATHWMPLPPPPESAK